MITLKLKIGNGMLEYQAEDIKSIFFSLWHVTVKM